MIVRGNAFFRNQIRDADRDDTRLARAGTGKNEQRSFGGLNGLDLLRI